MHFGMVSNISLIILVDMGKHNREVHQILLEASLRKIEKIEVADLNADEIVIISI